MVAQYAEIVGIDFTPNEADVLVTLVSNAVFPVGADLDPDQLLKAVAAFGGFAHKLSEQIKFAIHERTSVPDVLMLVLEREQWSMIGRCMSAHALASVARGHTDTMHVALEFRERVKSALL